MTDPPIAMNDLSRTPPARASEIHDAVLRVLRSGRYLLGPENDEFEREFADFVGVDHCIAVASGTDALTLALLALGAGPGVEVVLAANAGGYGSIAAAQVGAQVVYADVDPETACLTVDSVRAAIGPRTRIVLVTHLYGNVAPVAAIRGLSDSISVIEDCAQAIGGAVDHSRVGSMGTAAAFSFYPTKNLGASGDAGAVTTNDPAIADRLRVLRQYGWREKYSIALNRGRNSRMDELQAAVLRIGLGDLPARNERRRTILGRYRSGSPQLQWITGSTDTVAHLAVARVHDRSGFRQRLSQFGIATDIHYPIADHQQPGLPDPARQIALPVTESLVAEVVSVPCHPDLRDDEVQRVVAALGVVG